MSRCRGGRGWRSGIAKLFSLAGAMAACALFAPGCVSATRVPPAQGHDFGRNNPRLCVAMGDSITAGGAVSYPVVLSRMLRKTIANRGVPGSHSAEGAAEVRRLLTIHKPGYLLILYGANDVVHFRERDQYIANLRTMVRAAKENGTVPVLATMTPMTREHSRFSSTVRAFNVKVRELAKSEGVALCDLELHFMAAGAMWGTLLKEDGLHPDEQGTRLIAKCFYDVLR